MFSLLLLWFGALFRLFRGRRDLVFENFVLRQQLAVRVGWPSCITIGKRSPR
jgi:hypothetical protein